VGAPPWFAPLKEANGKRIPWWSLRKQSKIKEK
jgi:hypothetical protein